MGAIFLGESLYNSSIFVKNPQERERETILVFFTSQTLLLNKKLSFQTQIYKFREGGLFVFEISEENPLAQ
jgi:hypothetical protein